ncbi:uncharacterized protein LOC128225064 [Mya arenaria]|uniref:uncharacterized protein LOC128225064 n=1 Tax=Mya arenaria TaxID=6604 RepID=UPI0022E3C8FA|nr:uncharacterized protein LOC128225064 [Mya arenaria]
MASYKTILEEKDNQNWLKSSLALRITKSGLRGLAEDRSSRTQQNILTSTQQANNIIPGTTCNNCLTENLFQCPTWGLCSHPRNCKFHDTPNKMQRPCLSQICGGFKNEIINVHRFGNPSWKNTRAEMWCTNHWEVAKCFMGEGYQDVKSFDDTDFNGVISLMLNCKEYEGDFSFPIANISNLLTEARDAGRKVRHSPDLKVSDAELTQYFNTLTTLMSDPQYLAGNTNAQEALQKLHQLKADNMHISMEDVQEVLEEARVVIETGRHQLDRIVQVGMNESLNKINDKTEQSQREIYRRTEEGLEALDKAVEEAAGKIQTVTLTSSAEQEEDFRQRLAKCYLKTLHTVQISPLVSERDELLERIYVPPKIVIRNHRRVKTTAEDEVPIPATCYRQVLCKDDKFVGRIFLVGEAGMGKSTFSAKIALDWARKCTLPNKDQKPLAHIESNLFQDVETLENIEFLFHVTLRDASRMCNFTQIIKDQLINRLFDPDENTEAYKMLKLVLLNRTCVIIADGLDEWTHPSDLECSCKEQEKVVPFLSPTIDTTILITSRPWRMAQHPVSDSGIDKLLGIEGTADTEQLVQNVLQCLDGELYQKDGLKQFMSYVHTRKMVNLLSIPITVMMLVCLWFQGEEESLSFCDIYAHILAMMFKKTQVDTICKGDGIRLPRCFCVATQFSNILVKLAHIALSKLYASDRSESLVFGDVEELKREELVCLLKTGVIRESKTRSLINNTSNFSFIHKTVQEFLAALYLSIHPDAFDRVIKPYHVTNKDMTDSEKVFIFVCGMNCDLPHRMSELLCNNLSCTSYEGLKDNYTYQVDIPSEGSVLELQNIIISGHQEALNNGIEDIYLALYAFSIKRLHGINNMSTLKTLLSMNKSKVRYINISDVGEHISEEELQEVFRLSSNALIGVSLSNCSGRYDLSACTRLQNICIVGRKSSYIKVNTESLVACNLMRASSNVETELFQSLIKGYKQLKHLSIDDACHIGIFLQTLPLLTKLEYVYIGSAHFKEGRPILLPASVTHIALSMVKMPAITFQGLVDWMERSNHTVVCRLSFFYVKPRHIAGRIKHYIRSSRNFMVINEVLARRFEFCSVKEWPRARPENGLLNKMQGWVHLILILCQERDQSVSSRSRACTEVCASKTEFTYIGPSVCYDDGASQMASYKTILEEKDNQNWLKSSLALRITKSGLRGLAEDGSSRTQQNIHSSIQQANKLSPGTKCSQCLTENLFLCPTRGLCSNPRNCKFHNTPNKMQRPCPSQICGDFRNEIVSVHRFGNPSWKNTRSELWCTNHWEVAKCFMGEGYQDVNYFDDTDFNGVISLMLNCKEYEVNFFAYVANVPNLLTEARDVGRKVRHNPDLKVSDAELAQYFNTLTVLLSDPQYLAGNTNAQEALRKLHQLFKDNLYISTEDIQKELQDARLVIETGKLQLERTARDGMNEVINQSKQSVSQVIDESQLCQREIYSRTNEGLQALDTAVEEAVGKIQKVTLSSIAEQEEDLRQRLAKCYLRSLHCAPISPFVSEKDEKLERFYVPPKVFKRDKRRIDNAEKKQSIPVTCYKDVLCKDDKFVGRVFLVGEAGMGKSTFTAKIALDWSRKLTSNKKQVPLTHIERNLFQDVETLEKIEFLFHVTLRDAGGMCNLTQMIKDQLINRLYESDDYMDAFKTAKRVLSNRTCLIVADGLDEWTHPCDLNCSCKGRDKVVPFLSPNIDATVLITTRPWRMAQHPVSDSGIDKLLGIEGAADTDQLVQNVLQCLDGELDQSEGLKRFMLYVRNKNMVSFMSIPIIVMMLVCLWFQGVEESFSHCDIYAHMVVMMFRKTECIDTICQGNGVRLPRCFREATQYSNFLVKLANFAFHRLYAADRRESLVFRDCEELTQEELVCLLKTGVIRETKTHSLIKNTSSFSFIHKTVQEFLASLHVSIHPDTFDRVIKPYYVKNQDITDFEKVFVFVCGMNCDFAHRMSELLCDNLSYISYEGVGHFRTQVDIPSTVRVSELQNIIFSGHKEASNNGIKNISLALHAFKFNSMVKNVSTMKSLLSMNKSKVRYIDVFNVGEPINEEDLQEVFRLSSNSLEGVTLFHCSGRYDLSACSCLKYLYIYGSKTLDINVNTDCLLTCCLFAGSNVQKELLKSLRKGDKQLKHFSTEYVYDNVDFYQTLPLLTKLKYLYIENAYFDDRPLLLPASVTHIQLSVAGMAERTIQRLVDWMESSNHTVECRLSYYCVLPYREIENIKDNIRSSRNFMVTDGTNMFSKVFQFCSVKD